MGDAQAWHLLMSVHTSRECLFLFLRTRGHLLLLSGSRNTPEVTAGNFSPSHPLSAFPILTLNAQHPECGGKTRVLWGEKLCFNGHAARFGKEMATG